MSTTSTPSENERLRTHNEFLKTALRAQRIFTAPGGYDQSEVLAVLGMTNESFASFAARERLNAPSALREMVERVVVQALSQDAPITPAVQPVSAGTRPTGRAGRGKSSGKAHRQHPTVGHYSVKREQDGGEVTAIQCLHCPRAEIPQQHRREGDKSGQPRYNRARAAMVKHLYADHKSLLVPMNGQGAGQQPTYHA